MLGWTTWYTLRGVEDWRDLPRCKYVVIYACMSLFENKINVFLNCESWLSRVIKKKRKKVTFVHDDVGWEHK